jgi:DNA-binding MarR family transcriptional regulator
MRVPSPEALQLVRALAAPGNLFLVLTLQELRRQGLTSVAFYALQRVVGNGICTERSLRKETGLPEYEVSRACRMLVSSGLVESVRSIADKRVRELSPTQRGIRVCNRILMEASRIIEASLTRPGRERQLEEASASFRKANVILRDSFQLSFFDDLAEDPKSPTHKRQDDRRATTRPQRGRKAS